MNMKNINKIYEWIVRCNRCYWQSKEIWIRESNEQGKKMNKRKRWAKEKRKKKTKMIKNKKTFLTISLLDSHVNSMINWIQLQYLLVNEDEQQRFIGSSSSWCIYFTFALHYYNWINIFKHELLAHQSASVHQIIFSSDLRIKT